MLVCLFLVFHFTCMLINVMIIHIKIFGVSGTEISETLHGQRILMNFHSYTGISSLLDLFLL